MNETPRTDAAEKLDRDNYEMSRECGNPAYSGNNAFNFARTLERELATERGARQQAEQERDDLRSGFDALVKGTIAAKEKSNAELERLRVKLKQYLGEYDTEFRLFTGKSELREACGFIESKTLESDEKEILRAKLAAACFHLRCAKKERDELREKLHACLAAATGAAVSVHYREGGKFDSEAAAAVRTLRAADYEALTGGADYGAVKLELKNAQQRAESAEALQEAKCDALLAECARWEEGCRFNAHALMEALRQSDQEQLLRDKARLDWIQANSNTHWPYGNLVGFNFTVTAENEFVKQPTVRQAIDAAMSAEDKYPCARCGKLRTKAEGGTTFTICEECREKK